MKVQGRIKKLMPEANGISRVGNHWRRVDFIFEYFDNDKDQFADTVLLSVMNDKIDEFAMKEGEEVIIDVRHQVKTYGERLYTELWIKSFEKVATQSQQMGQEQQPAQPTQLTLEQQAAMERLDKLGEQAATGDDNGSKEDELPF